jgi:hypothetical protein
MTPPQLATPWLVRPVLRDLGLIGVSTLAAGGAYYATSEATAVRSTIERIRDEGELDDSALTDADLALAERGFSRALQAMYHRRVSYPTTGDGAPARSIRFPRRPRRVAS